MNDSYPGVKFNKTFRGDYTSELNACVGNNGSPYYYEYANGFADAAVLLIDNAIKSSNVDELVYPICFNMRHSVELRLKYQIECLELIRSEISLEDFDACKSHDIGNIWAYFKVKAPLFDRRFASLISGINEHINDIAKVDPTGQTFRYPLNDKSAKHLTQVSLINILILKERFSELSGKLENLHFFTKDLIEEYRWGTHTKKLSRNDISIIANRLPPYSTWKIELKAVKNQIKREYSIGSKEFSQCLHLIMRHYEFSKIIGIEVPLKHATLDDLYLFLDISTQLHPPEIPKEKSQGIYWPPPLNAQDCINENTKMDVSIKKCRDGISPAALCDISALIEYGRHGEYTELYSSTYARKSKLLPSSETSQNDYYGEALHLLSKANIHVTLLKALNLLNQKETVRALKKFSQP